MYTSVSNNVALISAGFFVQSLCSRFLVVFHKTPNEIPTAPPVGGGYTAGQMHAVALGCLGPDPHPILCSGSLLDPHPEPVCLGRSDQGQVDPHNISPVITGHANPSTTLR